MENFYNDSTKTTTEKVVSYGITAVVLFGLIFVAGRAWKMSQKQE